MNPSVAPADGLRIPADNTRSRHLVLLSLALIAAMPMLFGIIFPDLGTSKSALAAFTLLAALLAYFSPQQAVLLSYPIILAFTSFLACIGIEEGAYLYETGITGRTGTFSASLLIFYFVFFATFVLDQDNHSATKRKNIVPQQMIGPFLAFVLLVALFGIAAGLAEGFSLLRGENRYGIRANASQSGQVLFNLYLNNRTCASILCGLLLLNSEQIIKISALLGFITIAALSILHGEQFMATLQFCLTALIPYATQSSTNLGKLRIRLLMLALFAVLIGAGSLLAAYSSQNVDPLETMQDRFILQGQVWYAVTENTGLVLPPKEGGLSAFIRTLNTLLDWNSPDFDTPISSASGLRDIMYTYGMPDIVLTMSERNVTFTMGQFAVPVYWFGYLGAIAFVILTGIVISRFYSLTIRAIGTSNIVSIWFCTKVLSNAQFGMQQGEYWYIFGLRQVLFLAISYATIAYLERPRQNV